MICLVEQPDIGELEISDEVLEEGDSLLILQIYISVSSDKKKGICVDIKKFINANLQICKRIETQHPFHE